jgi:RHS repeat-associated protein
VNSASASTSEILSEACVSPTFEGTLQLAHDWVKQSTETREQKCAVSPPESQPCDPSKFYFELDEDQGYFKLFWDLNDRFNDTWHIGLQLGTCGWGSGTVCKNYDPITGSCPSLPFPEKLKQDQCPIVSGVSLSSNATTQKPAGYQSKNNLNFNFTSTGSGTSATNNTSNFLVKNTESILQGWSHTYNRRIIIEEDGSIYALKKEGQKVLFTLDSSQDFSTSDYKDFLPDLDLTDVLKQHINDAGEITGWTLIKGDNSSEKYTSNGVLFEIADANKFVSTLSYENGLLKTVTGPFGRELNFEYEDGLISKLIDPAGTITDFKYTSNKLKKVTYPDTRFIEYLYEDDNNPLLITGVIQNGVQTEFYTYDLKGRIKTSSQADGVNKLEIEYDGEDSKTVRDALGSEQTYTFKKILGVPKVVNITGDGCSTCGDNIKRKEYYAFGSLKLTEDAKGKITKFVYLLEDPDLLRTKIDAVGTELERTTQIGWYRHSRLLESISVLSSGKYTKLDYNSDNQIESIKIVDSKPNDSQITTFDYHENKLLKSIDGPRLDVDDITYFEYDTQGNRIEIRNALGHITQLQNHDAHGKARTIIDPNELVTTIKYDEVGRIKQTTTGIETTIYTYDPVFGLLETIKSADDNELTLSYNDAKQLTQIKDQHGNTITFHPDKMGNTEKTEVKDSDGTLVSTTTQIFNKKSQLEKILSGEGQIQGLTYDELGNIETNHLISDNAQPDDKQNTQYFYDILNRQDKIIDAKDGVTQFTYDNNDNLKTLTDPNENTTYYDYDGFDNLKKQDSPDTGVTIFTYDLANNIKTQLDNKQQLTVYEYDALNRVTDITYQDGQTEHYDYDQGSFAEGRLSQVTSNTLNSNIVYKMTYNSMGRVETSTQTVDSHTASLTYGYNNKGQLESLIYPSGKELTYGYSNGEMVSISIDGTPLISNIKYEAFGPVKAWDWSNGLKHSKAFDLSGRLESHSLNQDTRTIGYSDANEIKKITDSVGSRDYSYDDLHRLVSGTHLGQSLLYDYDANSNRLLSSVDGEQTDYVVDTTSNQITQVGDNTIDYDLNGNITVEGTKSYAYDAKNRFINFNDGQVLYSHNTTGLRVKKAFRTSSSNAATDVITKSIGNHIDDSFTGSNYTDILRRADNTWASNGQGTAYIEGNQANLFGGIALSQTVGTLMEDESYTLNAKLTQGEISVSSGGSKIVNIRYGFGQNLYITAVGLDKALNVNTPIFKDKLDVHVTWKAGEVLVVVTGTDGIEYTTGAITNSNITVGQEQGVELRDYFSNFYTQIFGQTVYIDDITVVASDTRVAPEPSSQDKLYHYNDAGLLTTEFDGYGNVLLEHIYLGSTPIAVIKGGTTYFVHTDHLGTPRSITRKNNTVVWGWESKPFGDDKVRDLIGLEYNLRHPGQYFDQESELFYNWNRTYNPETGRYLESDPIGLNGGLNTYGYVGGNPNSFVDPNGLSAKDVEQIIRTINDSVTYMNDNKLRLEDPYTNNLCRKAPWFAGCDDPNKLKDCGEQTEYTNIQLRNGKYDDNWYFLVNAGFGHAWGVAVSSNPSDPKIHFDPRSDQISLDAPCSSCEPWFGDTNYNDDNPFLVPPPKKK